MCKNIVPFIVASIFALSGCSALQTAVSGDPPVGLISTPTDSDYVAPTLPPVHTETPTATITPTHPASPTPFTIVEDENQTPQSTETVIVPTPAFTFTNWERFEATRFDIAIDVPTILQATVLGRNITIASPADADVPVPLNVEIRIDTANSFQLPEGVNPADPRSVLDGMLNEFSATYDNVSMIRPVINISVRNYPAAEAAARTSLGEGETAEANVWYLAVIVYEETVVRVYASSPAETGVAHLAVAERITDSLEFLPEP